jgi:hypothetical protein
VREEISKIQIESAFLSGKNDLSIEEYSWISDSSLTERAYLLGIFSTRKYLGDTFGIDGEMTKALLGTVFAKPGDKPNM